MSSTRYIIAESLSDGSGDCVLRNVFLAVKTLLSAGQKMRPKNLLKLIKEVIL